MDKTFYQQYKDLDRGLNSRQFLDGLKEFNHCERAGRDLECNCDKKVLPKFKVPAEQYVHPPEGACEMKRYRLVDLRNGPNYGATIGGARAYECQIIYRLQPVAAVNNCHWVSDC